MTGNRCDHDPRALRLCDIVRRGKGGHPQLLGVMSSYLNHAVRDRAKLRALDDLNPSGRRKRSEQYEVILAVCGFLTARWFQPDTRRCAQPTTTYLQVPDAAHIAGEISRSPAWQGKARLSIARVYAALENLKRAGYLAKAKQPREQLPSGEWLARPKIIAFTKKFFLDLGGDRLWRSVRGKGTRIMQDLRAHLGRTMDAGKVKAYLSQYLNPGRVLSPRQARAWNQRHGPPDTPHLWVRQFHQSVVKLRLSQEEQNLFTPPAF